MKTYSYSQIQVSICVDKLIYEKKKIASFSEATPLTFITLQVQRSCFQKKEEMRGNGRGRGKERHY